jgi:chitinase
MKTLSRWLRAAGLVLGVATLTSAAHGEKRVVGYLPNWIDLAAFSQSFAFDKLTHLNLAFENPRDAEGNLSFQRQNALVIERARAAKVKVLLSIGGGGAAEDPLLKARYAELLGDERRAGFVAKLVAVIDRHQLDGLDVDLEGPTITADYGAFIADLAAVLKPKGRLLTAALSQGYGGNRVPDASLQHLDFLNIMAYDAVGSWAPERPGQHASLENAGKAVDYWLGRGVPASKAVLGVPFYGYGFGTHYRKSAYGYAEILKLYPGAEIRWAIRFGITGWPRSRPKPGW